jgi:hypothetical protein
MFHVNHHQLKIPRFNALPEDAYRLLQLTMRYVAGKFLAFANVHDHGAAGLGFIVFAN